MQKSESQRNDLGKKSSIFIDTNTDQKSIKYL